MYFEGILVFNRMEAQVKSNDHRGLARWGELGLAQGLRALTSSNKAHFLLNAKPGLELSRTQHLRFLLP